MSSENTPDHIAEGQPAESGGAPDGRAQRSLIWQIALPVPIVLIVFLAAGWFFIPRAINANVEQAAIDTAVLTVNQYKKIRGYYTKNVVKKALANGGVRPSINHANEPDGIPLPATFIHDISALLKDEAISLNLFSAFPFPNRGSRQLDDFQQTAWAFLEQNPDEIFSRREEHDGVPVVRVAVADRMVAEGCVNCHNSHPDSPKTDWKLGDVRGILEISSDVAAPMAAGAAFSNKILIAVVFAGALLIAICLFGAQRIAKPIKSMTAVMRDLAQGEKGVEIPSLSRKDEVGAMAQAVQVFKTNIEEIDRLEAERKQDAERLDEEKRRAAHALADGFEAELQGLIEAISTEAEGLNSTAETMSGTATQSQTIAQSVTHATEEATGNAQAVASAVEELTASIQEISQQTAKASEIAGEAADRAAKSNAQIDGLVEQAKGIGEVVSLISDIAEQTNLLALNATIEAARAGEMGKGFAVVASEVKNLASQTAKATEEIASQIEGIQGATGEAAEAIGVIGETINQINEVSVTVTAAVEEQSATTTEISRSVQQVAEGTGEISSSISKANDTAQETNEAAATVLNAAGELSSQTKALREEVERFVAGLRAA